MKDSPEIPENLTNLDKRFDRIHTFLMKIKRVRAVKKIEFGFIIYYYLGQDFFVLDIDKEVLVVKHEVLQSDEGKLFFQHHQSDIFPYPYLKRNEWDAFRVVYRVALSDIYTLITLTQCYFDRLIK